MSETERLPHDSTLGLSRDSVSNVGYICCSVGL